jgi:hypothetical protein
MVYQHKYKFILYFSHYKEKVFLYLIHFFIKKLGAQTFESIKLMATKKMFGCGGLSTNLC